MLLWPILLLVLLWHINLFNFMDGIDGLAASQALFFAVAALWLAPEMMAWLGYLLCVLAGTLVGFLVYNWSPARMFMGDVGSLSLGGALGTIAVITKQEIVLIIVGGIFVMEALSVIMQVGYFKMTKGKRIFLMAPFHHHFEKKGWAEPTIVIRFWIIAIILALIGLSTLKLR